MASSGTCKGRKQKRNEKEKKKKDTKIDENEKLLGNYAFHRNFAFLVSCD